MNKYYQLVTINNSKLIVDNQKLKDDISTLKDGDYILSLEYIPKPEEKSIKDWQKLYFHIRDTLVVERDGLKTKETKEDMHEDIKSMVLYKIVENPENTWPEKRGVISTESLNPVGWSRFIESLKIWAWSELNTIV